MSAPRKRGPEYKAKQREWVLRKQQDPAWKARRAAVMRARYLQIRPPLKRVPLEQRLWAKTDKTGDCWLWTAHRNRQGYGTLRVQKRTRMAHRVAWELENGPIPSGLQVCHRCDNPPCVNPAHLFLGTSQDNKLDSVAKGRHAHGERDGFANLTAEIVAKVRREHAEGVSCAELARRHGVTWAAIKFAIVRRTWRHVA
jgi:hypothetical protein